MDFETPTPKTSRRNFCALAGGSLLAGVASAQDSVWEVVEYGGREYITAESIRVFYRFDRMVRDRRDLLFRNSETAMKWTVGQQGIFINTIKFSLSYPIVESGGKVLMSRMDLQKLIDPVLRPWYISNTEPFNRVTIDAGHGGDDVGARGLDGFEKDYALDLARRLKDAVEARGLDTHLTRDDDTFISLPGRVQIANRIDRSIFVSVHFNSGQRSASGIETYALSPQGTSSTNDGSVSGSSFSGNQRDGENIALATAVHAMVMTRFSDVIDRGIKRARFNVLRGINKPSILFEGGFVTNRSESRRIHSATYRDELAAAIADGIMNFRRAVP